MRGPTRLFATGTDPFGVKHYQEFTVMVCGADNFRWASKLNSTLLFEFRSTGQDFSMAYIEGLQDWIQIEVEGCMNRFELVTANGSLYNSTFVAISKDEKRIEVSNVVNNMVDLSIRATSPDG